MGNSMDGDGCCGEREEGKSENKPAFPGPKDGDTSPRLDAPEAAQRKARGTSSLYVAYERAVFII